MTVVADASPLIALERIGEATLLPRVLGSVVVPPAVATEVYGGDPLPRWIEVRAPASRSVGSGTLGRGEQQAIALALELEAD
jgi:predicted nucleic acid-binding protein